MPDSTKITVIGPTEYVTTKDGSIPLFDGENFGIFAEHMTSLFLSHGVLDIVNGTEAMPSPSSITATLAYRKKLTAFRRLITSGIRIYYRMLLKNKKLDLSTPQAYWTALTREFDHSDDKTYATNVRRSFENQTWNAETTPIIDFVYNLIEHKMLLDSSTKYGISYEELIEQVFQRIPNTSFWKGTKDICKDQNFDLKQTIRRLQEDQRTLGQWESSNQAEAMSKDKNNDNSRGRESRCRRGVLNEEEDNDQALGYKRMIAGATSAKLKVIFGRTARSTQAQNEL